MPPITVAHIEHALSSHRASRVPLGGFMKQAAVAAIVRDGGGGAELLLIRRSEREGDPWSGHIAFPGGRVEPGEEPDEAVVRETREEIGLDLRRAARPLGGLADVMAKAHGKPLPLIVRPFVFALPAGDARGDEGAPFSPNSEVQEVMWVSLAYLQERGNRGTLVWRIAGLPIELPCYRFGGGDHVLWGLTLKMVDELLAVVEG